MAKDSYEYEGSDFGDGLEYEDGAQPAPKGRLGQARKAVGEVADGAYNGFFNNFKDSSKWKEAVIKELPPQHKYVYDTYESVVRTGDELYDQFVNETRPVLGEISKKLDDMVGENSMFKGITNKLKDKFYDAPHRQQGEESILEDALARVMTETFGGIDILQQQREEKEEKRRVVRDVTEQKMGQYQHEELMAAIKPLAVGISRLETFKLQIESKVQKKQLELSFRTMMVQGKAYEHQRKSHIEIMDQIKAMVKNTALPEYAKIEKGEKFKEILRDRAFGGIQNALFGQDSAMGQMLGKFKRDMKDGISAFSGALKSATMGLDMAEGMFGKDSPMSIFETLGTMAGGELGDKARKAFITPIMDKLKDDPEFQRKGHNVAQLMRDPRLLIDLLKDTDVYRGLVGGTHGMKIEDIITQLQGYLRPEMKLGKFGSGVEGLHKPGFQTERMNRVQTDVVPGYLARILQQVTSANTLKPEPLLVYDYGSNSFVARSAMLNKLSKHMREYNEKSSFTSSARNSASSLLEEMGLKEEDRNALAAAMSLMARSETAITGKDIRNFDGYAGASDAEKRILERINEFAGKNKDLKSSATMSNIRKSVEEIKQSGDNMSGVLQRLFEEGHGELLEELGIIEIDKDNPGVYKTNKDSLEKMQRNGLYATSDINTKSGIRKIDKSKALRGIRQTPVSQWNYKNSRKKHIGPMAQDVNKQFGDDMAPDGKEIDLINMNGAAMAAIQKIAEDQERLATSDQGSMYLKAIAKAVGAGETNTVADSNYTAVDYLKILADQVSKTNYLLENNRLMVSIPGIDFSKFNMQMPDIDLEKIKANGKKFVDPLIKTGNVYIDTIQSMMFSAIRDGFELGKTGLEKGKEGLKTGKKWFFDAPANWLMEVLMRNEKEIKDKREWLYKKSVEAAGNAIDFGMSVITEKIPNAIKSTFAFLKDIKEGIKRVVNPPRDIYVKGNTEPVMQAETMRRSGYVDESNKAIRGIDDLLTATGSIRNIHTGSVVLTQTQLSEGVFDQEGNQLRTTRALGLGLVGGAAQAIGRAAVGAAKWLSEGTSFIDKGKEAFNSIKSGIGNFFSGGFNMGAFGTDARLLRMTAQIRDLLAFDKPRKLVTQVYKRDLYKHPLEGKEFIASLYGKKFAERLFKKTKGGAKKGVDPSTGISTSRDLIDPNSPNPAGKDDDLGFMGNMKKAFSGYDKGKTFGQNMAAAMGRMGNKDPEDVAKAFEEVKEGVKKRADKSKTFNFFKDIYTKAKADYEAEQAAGPEGKKPGRWTRTKAAVGGLFKRKPKVDENIYDPDTEAGEKKGMFSRGKDKLSQMFKRKKSDISQGARPNPFDSSPFAGRNIGDIDDVTLRELDAAGTPIEKESILQRAKKKAKALAEKARLARAALRRKTSTSSPLGSTLPLLLGSQQGTLALGYSGGLRSGGTVNGAEGGTGSNTGPSTLPDMPEPPEAPPLRPGDPGGPVGPPGPGSPGGPPGRPRGRFGRMVDSVKNNKFVKTTTRNMGRVASLGKRMGVGGMLGGLATGIGGILLGSPKDGPQPTLDISGERLHKDAPAKQYATLAENKTGKATFYDVDGDGVRDNGSTKQLIAQDQHRNIVKAQENDKIKESQERAVALMDDRKKKDDDFLSKLMSAVGGIFRFITSGFGGIMRTIGSIGGTIGKVFGVGKKVVGGVLKVGKNLIGAGGKAAFKYVAARGLLGVATAAAASGTMAGTALGAVAFAARIAMGPVGWALLAGQVAWWAGKKIYKYVKRNDVDEFGRVRMYQYGLTDAEKDNFNKFLSLEEYLKQHISWQDGAPSINERSVKPEEILDIFDIDKEDKEGAEKLGSWFEDRFKPFFLNALASVKFVDPKAKFFDISKFDAKQNELLCSKLEFSHGPYDADTSPFKEGAALPNTFTEVKKLLVLIKHKVPPVKDKKGVPGTVDILDKELHAVRTEGVVAQEQAQIEKQREADKATVEANREKTKAEEERKKLLAKQDSRKADNDRAMMALQAASQNKNLADVYRDETKKLAAAQQAIGEDGQLMGPPVPANFGDKTAEDGVISDDGGKEPPKATEPTAPRGDEPAVTALPAAGGELGDPSKGSASIIKGKDVNMSGVNPEVAKALYQMADDYNKATGKKLRLGDGFRSYAEQARLYATLPKGKAARPGKSLHEFGAALDIASVDAAKLEQLGLMRKYGFTRPVGGETWHIEPAGIQGKLDRAKKDPNFLAEMMRNSYGRGGGGIGIKTNVRKYSRNDAYAIKLFNEGSSNAVALPKKKEEGDAVTGNATTALPVGSPPLAEPTSTPAPVTASAPQPSPATTGIKPLKEAGPVGPAVISDDGGKEPPVAKAESSPGPSAAGTPTGNATAGAAKPPVEGPSKKVSGLETNPYGDVNKTKSLIAKYSSEVGKDPGFMQVVAGLESSMGRDMVPHMGGAQGPFQFMPRTWKEQIGLHGKKYNIAPGTDPVDLRASTILAGEYFKSNEGAIKRLRGDNFNIVDSYLTHMLGPGNSRSFARLKDDEIAATRMPDAASYNQNVFFEKLGRNKYGRAFTAGEIRAKQLEKIGRTASEYGINLSGIAANFKSPSETEAANDPKAEQPGVVPATPPAQTSQPAPGAVVSGVSGSNASIEDKANEQIVASTSLASEKRQIESANTYTGPQPEVFTKPIAVQPNPEGVSGLRDVVAASSKSSDELVAITRDQVVPLLEKIDASLVKLYELKESGTGQTSSAPTGTGGVITPSSTLSRARKYGT